MINDLLCLHIFHAQKIKQLYWKQSYPIFSESALLAPVARLIEGPAGS